VRFGVERSAQLPEIRFAAFLAIGLADRLVRFAIVVAITWATV